MSKRLNILVSTSSGWNPGDDWIRMGCMNILNQCTDRGINSIYFNRNPDLRMNGKMLRDDAIGNYLTNQSLDQIDFVLLAGTPQWHSGIMWPLFKKILAANIPVLALGLGSGGHNFNLKDIAKEVFRRENTFITCRATGTADRLNQEIGIKKAVALPCPAFLSSIEFIETPKQEYAQIAQITAYETHKSQCVKDPQVLNGLDQNYPVICVYKDEWRKYSSEGFNVIFNSDPATLQEELSLFSKISSTRLHGAIASLSLGTPAVLVASTDYRLKSAAEIFNGVLPVAKDFNEAKNMQPATLEDIKKLKDFTFVEQSTIVKNFLAFNGYT